MWRYFIDDRPYYRVGKPSYARGCANMGCLLVAILFWLLVFGGIAVVIIAAIFS